LTPIRPRGPERSQGSFEGKTRLYIAKGSADGLTKKTLSEFIVEQTGIPKQLIENIEVFDQYSFVSVPFDKAERIIQRLKNFRFGQKRLFVEKAKPSTDRRRGPGSAAE
jgi:ATP-dependent RNA helicase DeaD